MVEIHISYKAMRLKDRWDRHVDDEEEPVREEPVREVWHG